MRSSLATALSCIHLHAEANIGVHDVHHLCSRIPFYRLQRVLRDHPELNAVGRLTLVQSLGCVRLVLWDEERRRLISFRELRRFKHVSSTTCKRALLCVAVR